MPEERKLCFVISPIGDPGTPTRKRADQVLKHVIRPAAEQCGYHAQRSDDISQPGIITNQVIQNLLEAPLVIADLTERNPNVFYEVAIRHLVRKPLVQMIEVTEQIPFDLAASRMIKIDHKDLDSAEEATKGLIAQIQAVEKDSSLVDNPISVAIDLNTLKTTGKPAEVQLAQLIEALAHEMRAEIAEVKAAIGGLSVSTPSLLTSMFSVPGTASYLLGGHPTSVRIVPTAGAFREEFGMPLGKWEPEKPPPSTKPKANKKTPPEK